MILESGGFARAAPESDRDGFPPMKEKKLKLYDSNSHKRRNDEEIHCLLIGWVTHSNLPEITHS